MIDEHHATHANRKTSIWRSNKSKHQTGCAMAYWISKCMAMLLDIGVEFDLGFQHFHLSIVLLPHLLHHSRSYT